MKSRDPVSKTVIKVTVILGIIVICIPPLYLFSIYFRGHVVPFYANTFYRRSVNKVFDDSFSPFNTELNQLGFDVSHKDSTCYNGLADNGDASFSGIKETVLCSTTIATAPIVPSASFITHWKKDIPNLQAKLISAGWKPDTANNQPFEHGSLVTIFDDPNSSNSLTYIHRLGSTHCQLVITNNYVSEDQQKYEAKYNPLFYKQNGLIAGQSADVHERCEHYINFFGGSGEYPPSLTL